jgi:hypothetical protein
MTVPQTALKDAVCFLRRFRLAWPFKNREQKMPDNADTIIFLDLDGVIADFEGHARSQGKMKTDGKPDYDNMERAWWASMPAYDGAKEFHAELKKLAPVKFLTAPIPLTDCFSGKADWTMKFVGGGRWKSLVDLIICPKRDKALLAGPKRVLVDDSADNIEAWRKAGGIGILHKGDFAGTLAAVRQAVAGLAPKPVAAPTPKFTP